MFSRLLSNEFDMPQDLPQLAHVIDQLESLDRGIIPLVEWSIEIDHDEVSIQKNSPLHAESELFDSRVLDESLDITTAMDEHITLGKVDVLTVLVAWYDFVEGC